MYVNVNVVSMFLYWGDLFPPLSLCSGIRALSHLIDLNPLDLYFATTLSHVNVLDNVYCDTVITLKILGANVQAKFSIKS